jgi:sugar/nucleoside kinase (ribokinase family)
MRFLRIDDDSPFRQLVGVGGLGTGIFFALDGDHTLGRNESRLGRLLDVRDYCKLHIVMHYVAKLLASDQGQFPVRPIGKVGDDSAGRFVLTEMRSVGMDTTFVKVVSGRPTLFSACFQYPDGNGGNITTSNSAAATLSAEEIEEAWSRFESVGPTSIALLVPEVPLISRSRFLGLAKQAGTFCVASFAFGEIAEAKRLGMFDDLDLVALNEDEAAEFAGEPSIGESAPNFAERLCGLLGAGYSHLKVLMSVGKDGAYCVDAAGWSYSPAPIVEVASTAGAGDCLLGGTLAALASGIPLRIGRGTMKIDQDRPRLASALDFGVLLASYKVSSPHTIHPDASLDDLLRFGQKLGIAVAPRIEHLFKNTVGAKTKC